MDYSARIDSETWQFIHRTDSFYPPETASFPIEKQRAIYDGMCREFFQGYPQGIVVADSLLAGVPCRHYQGPTPSAVRVVYFHGGGFVVGGLDSHDDICAEICARTGLSVTSADYRLSPEHKHPAAFEDALAVAQAALAQGPILLVGDSAGGTLAAAVAHRLRGAPGLLGQVLIYPGLGGNIDAGSYLEHAHAPMLTRDDVLFYKTIRAPNGLVPEGDPSWAPLCDTSFAGLPPTVAVAAECDPISDDARDYIAALQSAGVMAELIEEPGLVHGYLRARTTVARARESFTRIITRITQLTT
ncbi:MAG TPA: esterase [Rhodobacteraceae bacterium]|jgi:acetyl esterase|nr:esterase [Paracoccaceae bacterium]HBV53533.1 esterase [Paracoccaceae bacterium]